MSRTLRLLAIAAAMTALLVGMIIQHVHARSSGTEIVLDLEPVDPRDLLLGHYVIIRTPAHTLDSDRVAGLDPDWIRGDRIHVSLAPDGDGLWQPVSASAERPQGAGLAAGTVVMAGFVESSYRGPDWSRETVVDPAGEAADPAAIIATEPTAPPGELPPEITRVSARFNIERYYASPEMARELEGLRGENRLQLIVSVGADGSALIKGLRIDGETYYETLF